MVMLDELRPTAPRAKPLPMRAVRVNLPAGTSRKVHSRDVRQRSFDANQLPSTPVPLIFHDALRVLTAQDEVGWVCSIPELATSKRGPTEEDAITALTDALREEAQRLLGTASHRLEAAARERKGLLLGNIDVVASKIAESLGEHTWVLGQIETDAEGQRWFQEVGRHGERYSFAPDLAGKIPEDRFLRMAKVHTGAAGEPTAPVVELGSPLDDDPEKIRADWERLRDADS